MPVHTDLPSKEHFGELQLARALIAMDDPKMHLWFNVSWIPGVGEIDIIIWHESVGLFVCETKAVRLTEIKEVSTSKIWLSYQDKPSPSPQTQTLRKVYELQNQVRGQMAGRLPFIVPAVIWPRIRSSEWRQSFEGDVSRMADSMLFLDDISGSTRELTAGLRRVSFSPIIGKSVEPRPIDDPSLRKMFERAIESRSQKPTAKPSENERLQLLEIKAAQQALPDVPTDIKSRVIYLGPPGTGKTFRLLQLAANHCRAGRHVLYLCYNKTLAADVKRLFTLERNIQGSDNFPWTFDVMDLLVYAARCIGVALPPIQGNASEWFDLLRDELASLSSSLAVFDLVLIDEVQDMDDWMLEFGSMFLSDSGSIALAEGEGQQFYGQRSEWLQEFESTSKLVRLRRNFRNTAQTYTFASAMAEWARRTSVDSAPPLRRDDVAFERRNGRSPDILLVEGGVQSAQTGHTPAILLDKNIVAEYKSLILAECESLYKQLGLRDMLILVPQDVSQERRWALEALEELSALGVPFLDYTATKNNTSSWRPFKDNRRTAATQDMIRLCTYRSSRGLEAAKVVVFGLDRILEVSHEIGARSDALLHVILSRAIHETTIAWVSDSNALVKQAIDHSRAEAERCPR